MDNIDYKKPSFHSLLHQFEYDEYEYKVQVDKQTGGFSFSIHSFEIGEGGENKVYKETLYNIESDDYWEMKDLFFTFHRLVVPHETKVEAGYRDGTFLYPNNTDELFEKIMLSK